MAIKTFSSGEVLTASDTNTYLANAGLVYVAGASFTAQTTVDITGISSTYKMYRLEYTARRVDTAGTAAATAQFRSSTTAQASGYYYGGIYANYLGATGSLVAGNNQASAWFPAADSFGAQSPCAFDICIDQAVSASWHGTLYFAGGAFWGGYAGACTTSLTLDRLRVTYTSGTCTGYWRLYGYREP